MSFIQKSEPTAAIARLGERQTEDLKVPGSIPGLGIAIFLPQTSKESLRARRLYFNLRKRAVGAKGRPGGPRTLSERSQRFRTCKRRNWFGYKRWNGLRAPDRWMGHSLLRVFGALCEGGRRFCSILRRPTEIVALAASTPPRRFAPRVAYSRRYFSMRSAPWVSQEKETVATAPLTQRLERWSYEP